MIKGKDAKRKKSGKEIKKTERRKGMKVGKQERVDERMQENWKDNSQNGRKERQREGWTDTMKVKIIEVW